MRRASWWLAALVVAGGFLVAGTPSARAGDDATPAPAPVEPLPAVTPEKPKSEQKLSLDELEARLLSRPGAAVAMIALKYGPALVGLVVGILVWSRRRDERRGLVAPERAWSRPPGPFLVWPALVLGAVAMIGGGVVLEAMHRAFGGEVAKSIPGRLVATALGSVPVAAAVAFAIHRAWARRRGDGPASSPTARATPWPARAAWKDGLASFCVASTVVVVVAAVTTFVMTRFGAPAEPQGLVLEVVQTKSDLDAWLIAVFGVVVAPVTEEYLFRGMLYPAFRDETSPLAGAILSSVLFGAVHMSWTAGPALFALAFVLCRLYERTGSVWPGVLVHALNNATSLAPLLLLRYS